MSMDDESGTRAKMQAATLEIDGKVYKLELAKIEGTMFGWEDHGILTAMLTLDYLAGSFQDAGGYCLDESTGAPDYERRGTAYGLDHVMQIMRVVGVREWEKVKGQRVYALKAGGFGTFVDGLANVDRPESLFVLFKAHAAAWGVGK